ncbi:MAG: 16S rRNA (guanine(966)-N(2))-methyltransferase RsmD [bacterium]|nr:16S rRNA (guanine(966)-N(2))-methyltransferase RsmD [bacterium]
MRVVAGYLKGRKLLMDGRLAIRPTSDMAREALFSSLGERIIGASFLDVFSGTGAVSIEAVSRGATRVVAIECSRKVAELIRSNMVTCEIPTSALQVFIEDYSRALALLKGQKFDIIFSDPPYNQGLTVRAMELIDKYELLAPGGVLACEHFIKEVLPEKVGSMILIKERRYGQTRISYFGVRSD